MAGLFIQLDVEYASDDEVIDAGPMAELLFIRGLCFIKRKALDGHIKRNQLANVAGNIPSASKHALALVRAGLWQSTKDGWYCPSYLKRNPSKATLDDQKQAAREFGIQGNHDRWHVGPEGKPSGKCPLCRANRIGSASPPPIRDGSPYTETDPDSYPDPHTDSQTDPIDSSSQVTPPAEPPPGDDRATVNRIIQLIAEKRRGEYCKSRDPEVREDYLTKIVTQMNRNERSAIEAMLQERGHMRSAVELAAEFYESARAAS